MEFLVVMEENAADVLAEEPNDIVEPEPEPEPEPKPEPKIEEVVPPPPPLPDPVEEVRIEPPKPPQEKPKEKKVEPPKEKPKPVNKPKDKPKPKIQIGKRVGPITTGKKDVTKVATQKKLSDEEVQKLLGAGAKVGNKNQIPPNEASRVAGLIQAEFKRRCQEAGIEPVGGRAPVVKVLFRKGGSPGMIASISLASSSGNATHDNEVLAACRQVRSISGISTTYLKSRNYEVQVRINVE